jgi:uncharacterized protein
MPLDLTTGASSAAAVAAYAVPMASVFLIAFLKGAFGGGFAIVGIPLVSLVMDPLAAGALMAPLLLTMDIVALWFWRPATWSRPDIRVLVPGLVAGIGVGYLVLHFLDGRAVSIAMAMITLVFTALWLRGGATVSVQPRSTAKGLAAGLGAGITTMVAHAGGPPLAMYLLPLGLSKDVYAGTTSLFFTFGNVFKVLPWLWLGSSLPTRWGLLALCVPVIPLGVWTGWRLHQRLDQQQMYRACYGLLTVTALKLLWDGIRGYL